MKKAALIFFVFFLVTAYGWAQNPFEKYGPFNAKIYSSFIDALKEKDFVFKLQCENENLSKELKKVGDLNKLQVLALKNNQLDSLSKQIFKMSDLLYFSSTQNPLQKLPAEIMYWSQLNEMHLFHTALHSLPKEMSSLQALKILQIQNNQKDTFHLGEGCKKLNNLKSVIFYNNNFYSFPKELLSCVQLNEIVITSCKINAVPSEINALTDLQTLVLDSNEIKTIPNEIFDMPSIKYISLKNNQLTSISESFTRLPLLEKLDLSGNNIPEDRIAILRVLMPKCKIIY
ncbi:MAG: leucine-rich repeat domain-containing protein [Flavobacteriales bacterium]